MRENRPYNPLDKRHLAESVADKLVARPVESLPPTERFAGPGVYAIYYVGGFALYAPLVRANADQPFSKPIYVGKAIPEGGRKGGFRGDEEAPRGASLFKRLKEHAKSITQARNLELADFRCRYLVADEIWIPLGESMLIERFQPLWNVLVDGFGNHAPGSGRAGTELSAWDILHPGRAWAEKLTAAPVAARDELVARVGEFLERRLGG